MRFQSHFLRIATPPIASLLLILVGAALRPARAANSKGESVAERYVLEQVQNGEVADLNGFSDDRRKLSATFIARLLTNSASGVKIHRDGISIQGAVITGELYMEGQEVAYDVRLLGCTFEETVHFIGTKFAKNLGLTGSTFKRGVNFFDATIGFDFIARDCRFVSQSADFRGLRVGRYFGINDSKFDTSFTSFGGARVGGPFVADRTTFSGAVGFNNMNVEGRFSAKHCVFRGAWIGFMDAHFADLFLNDSSFDTVGIIDFTKMEADLISFDGVKSMTPSELILQGMKFKLLSPVNAEQLQFLLYRYNAELYTDLETSFRTHGYPDEADKIFIAKKRAERRENCKDFLRQCNRAAWTWSMFQDMVAGYGKRLQNLLYWSLGFLIIGTFVFRSEKGMRLKDPKDVAHCAGRYNAFWYSLDLFLPIIKLGEADVWTPKDDRRWANLYRKVHIIIGSLFVPIGLAAWTGIIR